MAQQNNGCATGCGTLLGLAALGFVLAYWQVFLIAGQGSLEVKQNSVPELVLASPAVPEAP